MNKSRAKRERGPRLPLNRIAASVALALAAGHAGAAEIILDGFRDSTYQLGFSIGFLDDQGNAIGDGKLFFGIDDAGYQYLYFEMPLSYVDNTYGANTSADWLKKDGKSTTHTFDDLLKSDSLGSEKEKGGLPFSWLGNEVIIDYLAATEECIEVDKKKTCTVGYRSGGVGEDQIRASK